MCLLKCTVCFTWLEWMLLSPSKALDHSAPPALSLPGWYTLPPAQEDLRISPVPFWKGWGGRGGETRQRVLVAFSPLLACLALLSLGAKGCAFCRRRHVPPRQPRVLLILKLIKLRFAAA